MTQTTLLEATDADFEAMLSGAVRLPGGLALPPGGVEDPGVLAYLRGLSARLRGTAVGAVRLMIADGEVVGTCGFKAPPGPAGELEIGYGVAAARRRRGHATRAVAALVAQAAAVPGVRAVTAETNLDNLSSQRVLAANGFARAGTRHDPQDGELILWRRPLP